MARVALGGWAFGGADWDGQRDADSWETMATAFELGIAHWDTAIAYGGGHAERLCGRFLRDKRDAVFVASKAVPESDADSMVRSLERSLRNLGTDYVDLYYFHWPRRGLDLRPHMERLEEARRRGLTRRIGVSNFSVEQLEAIRQVGTIDAHQVCYSLFWRRAEADILPYCRAAGIAVTTYSSLAQGILAGRFASRPRFREGDARSRTVFFEADVWPLLHNAAMRIARIAEGHGCAMAGLALQWVLRREDVTAVVVGARTGAQLRSTADALSAEVPPEALDAVTGISDDVIKMLPDAANIFRFDP